MMQETYPPRFEKAMKRKVDGVEDEDGESEGERRKRETAEEAPPNSAGDLWKACESEEGGERTSVELEVEEVDRRVKKNDLQDGTVSAGEGGEF